MFLRMGSVEARPRRSPAVLKSSPDSLPLVVVPSLREVLQPFSAVILTGGSSGIGKSFIQLGQNVAPHLAFCNLSRRPPDGSFTRFQTGSLHHVPCDLGDAARLAQAVTEIERWVVQAAPRGRVLLINNSGFGAFGAFADLPLERELQMIDLNVRAIVDLTGRLLPLLKQRGGAVLNIASVVAFQPTPYAATYGATKAFVLNWTVALNEELRGSGVRALAVCPGTTSTAFFRVAESKTDSAQSALSMSADRVAELSYRALGGRRAVMVPGWGNKLMTFFAARLPRATSAWLAGRTLASRAPARRA
jgi:uncharacterized protein